MIGSVLGNRYEILSEVGSGGMAKVYKAKDRYLQRIVAIKLLKEEFREDTDFLKRFDTEAQAAANLAHPNIVQIYDIGNDNDRYYIVMEYIDGITLKEYIEQKGSLSWRETVEISLQICSALAKAHSRNIIHRDVKPNNIVMTPEGIPKVTDFGIARSASNGTDTMIIDTIGSVHYSSPEQARGGYTDAQSDIYSIGVTMFEMATGTLPFDAETPVAVALKQIQDSPPVPSFIKEDIPPKMDEIILTAMAKRKEDRYPSVADLISDLEGLSNGEPGAQQDIVLPNIKRDTRFDTRKIENPWEVDEELSNRNRKNNSRDNPERKSSMNIVMPIIYVVLIITILGSIFFFVSMIIKEFNNDGPKEIILGNYVNRHIDEVNTELLANEIRPVNITYKADDVVPENHVISQFPLPDSKMKLGGYTTLELVVSLGSEMVEIPNVAWQDHTTMMYRLRDEYGLVVVEVPQYDDEVGVNMAIRTDPPATTQVKKGSKVTLYWSLGPEKEMVVVPDLIGDTYDAAVRKLTNAKLKLGETFPADREGHSGKIIDQAPKPGETVEEDTAVAIFFEEDVPEPGATTQPPGTESRTITLKLPPGYEPGETVRVRVYIADNMTGDETIFTDKHIPASDFPASIIVPVNAESQMTVRAYLDDTLVFNQTF